jgi:exosortase A
MNQDHFKKLPASHFVFLSVILLSFIGCYYSTINWMYERYISPDTYYSHGFLIPFVSGYIIWQKKELLMKTEIEISWWGFVLIITSILFHLMGTVLYIFSISGFSIFFMVIGLSLFLFGKNVTRIILFPLLFLVFMFPLPLKVISMISFPMKILVTKVSVSIVSSIGIPVFREGFNISIPAGNLLVGNPCSGLRSLITFLALGAVFAYFSDMSLIKKNILFSFSIPVAIASNMVRVPMLILISHFWGLEAAAPDSFWHDASGVLVFIIGLLILIISGWLLDWKK